MHDSSTCPTCRGLPIGDSMSDERFFSFVAECRDELALKQPRFQQRIAGATRWSYDLADCSLTIGSEQFRMSPIGTYSATYQSWLWAWANEEFPAAAHAAALPLQALHEVTGFQMFLDPGMPARVSDVEDLVALAIHRLDAAALFRVQPVSDCPTLYLAVHERWL